MQAAHVRRLGIQATLYVFAFFVAYGPQIVIRMLTLAFDYDRTNESEIYWLLVLNSICYPLQGFLNMFVYSRPNYLRLREAGMPFWQAVRSACFATDIPKLVGESTLRIQSSK